MRGKKEKRVIWGRVRNPNLFLGHRKLLWRRSYMWTVNWRIVKNWPNKNVVGVGTHRGHTTRKDTGERVSHNRETEKVWQEYVWKGEDQETKLRRKWGQTLGSLCLLLERIFIALWALKSLWGAVSSKELWWELWSRDLFCWWVKNGSERSKSEGENKSIAVILARSDSDLD